MTAAVDGMEVETRRTFLLAVVRNNGGLVTTSRALQIYSVSPWNGAGRNTARRDLRDLARRAYLVPAEHRGARFYRLGDNPNPRHPSRYGRQGLLETIRQEGGEWTAGRAKAAMHRAVGTHILRASARRNLADLHWLGHLDRHGDGTARLYYTPRQEGATA
ncbi:hypothetical protein [Streptomyces mirabilis]|uniref:hypothetical protein n=1 Tax=Streptomyces mirabilis TaxID=68239 RepID=UPI0033D4AA0E